MDWIYRSEYKPLPPTEGILLTLRLQRAMAANETQDWKLGPFILQSLLLLVAPALYAASIYMMLGRIILLTDGEQHSMIRKRWLTKIFVAGDVASFMMQGAGKYSHTGRNPRHLIALPRVFTV